ncbi:MAG: hypothetical protein ACRDY6_21875 [Acidimicrobiia bacterium]
MPRTTNRLALSYATVGGVVIELLKTATSHWLFDRRRKRFLRLPREMSVDAGVLLMPWEPYEELSLDTNGRAAVVTFDDAGLRRLRVIAA